MQVETVLDGLVFPECPRWHDGALFFSDQHDGMVWRLAPDGRASKVVEVPGQPSGLGWLPDGTLLIVSMRDRRVLRLTVAGLETHADLSAHAAHDCNDMVVDHAGRAYIGNFGFDLNHGERPRAANLLRVDSGGEVSIAAAGLMFPNGAAITPGGKELIIAETYGACLTSFDLGEDGTLSNRRVFAPLPGTFPDGICLDEEGCVWVACPTQHRIIRVRRGGEITHTIPLPGRDSFACALGGADGRDLYVCTALDFHPENTLRQRAGKIEVIRPTLP